MSIATVRQEPVHYPLTIEKNNLFHHAFRVVKTLQQAGHEAYLVGGSIRDLWMGITPEDCDITTSAHPDQVMQLFPRTVPVGVQFGTVMVLQSDHPFEVTTFRADGRYEDGRRPSSVSFSTRVIDDLERRDFTINGLIYSTDKSQILDYTGGIEDVQRRVIRTIGPPHDRFAEDRLRMLRAIRFAARFAFQIDPHTFDAIRNWAPKLLDVSVERIQQEFLKTLQCRYPARGIQLFHESGLLAEITPEITSHSSAVLRLLHFESLQHKKDILALALLLADVPPSTCESLLQRLRFSREYTSDVTTILHEYPRFLSYSSMSVVERKKFLRQSLIQEILALITIVQYQDPRYTPPLQQAQQDLQTWSPQDLHPPRLVDGNKLKQLGYKPGPRFAQILQAIEEEQLQGNLQTFEQIVSWLEAHFADQKG